VAFLTWLLIWRFVGQFNRFTSLSESILASLLGTFLAIIGEMRVISLIPVSRPLDYLPAIHIITLIGIYILDYFRAGAGPWRFLIGNLSKSTAALWNQSGLLLRTGLGLSLCVAIASLVLGLSIGISATWDEMAYHSVQAIQCYQDGRIGMMDSWLPWSAFYPKGAALVWAWTMLFTHSDFLFHPVQLVFGLQFVFATYVLARRTGGTGRIALAASMALFWMPITMILTTAAGADLGYAAACVSILAFCAPPRTSSPVAWSYLFAAFALWEAALIKLPILAIIFAAGGASYVILTMLGRRPKLLQWRFVIAGAIAIAVASVPYARNWIQYRNPFYPIDIPIGHKLLFRGPSHVIGGVVLWSQFRDLPQENQIRRYHAALTDWFNDVGYDSAGTFGPVVLAAAGFLFLAFAINAFRSRNGWWAVLTAVVVVALVVPGTYLPRYGIGIMASILAAAAVFLAFIDRNNVLEAAFVVISMGALPFTAIHVWTLANYMHLVNGRWFSPARSTIFQETLPLGAVELYPSAEMMRAVRETSMRGDLLVWDVDCFPSLLWNHDYSNRVLFLPGTPRDRVPSEPHRLAVPTSDEMTEWLTNIRELRPSQVLVYTQSAYPSALAALKAPEYSVRFREPAIRGKSGMTLFQRVN
jgi:hypothetical protein